ncbi:MAG: hypothetical protein EXR62_05465 [Chloroflexi bacterium]|nr:hypothetical protein [Chloroflexota bacterium]
MNTSRKVGLGAVLGILFTMFSFWLGISVALAEAPPEGARLGLPNTDTDRCETLIQIQNVGTATTGAVLVLFGDAGPCAPQATGPIAIKCTGLMKPGSAWTFTSASFNPGAKSAILYSTGAILSASGAALDPPGLSLSDVCETFYQTAFNDFQWRKLDAQYQAGTLLTAQGDRLIRFQPLAVVVDRRCPGNNTLFVDSNEAYTGITKSQTGQFDTTFGGYMYYTPLVFARKGDASQGQDFNSLINVQNLGSGCANVVLWFQSQNDCLRYKIGDIPALAPGQTYTFNPNTVVGPGFQGSAWIRSSTPLGIVVDNVGRDMMMSYVGVPAEVAAHNQTAGQFTYGSPVNYAPLIYREYNGWSAGIQVQNLNSHLPARVRVYFFDQSGDIITSLLDWICPRGSQTFFLPTINNLPGNYVGYARIESQQWFAAGDPLTEVPNILSIVNLIRYADASMSNTLEATTYNALPEQQAFDFQVGTVPLTYTLAYPILAKGFQGINSEISIVNLNPNPGFTDYAAILYDQNGAISSFCGKLGSRQVDYIDISTWGAIPANFMGSLVIIPKSTTQAGGYALAGVEVERIGRILTAPDIQGDESKAFTAIPILTNFIPESLLANCQLY